MPAPAGCQHQQDASTSRMSASAGYQHHATMHQMVREDEARKKYGEGRINTGGWKMVKEDEARKKYGEGTIKAEEERW